MTAEADKTLINSLLLLNKEQTVALKGVHDRLLKRKSLKLKELDPMRIDVDISFSKMDFTDVFGIFVLDRQ